MSDISIPGLGTGKFNTPKIIEAEMATKKVHLDDLQNTVTNLKDQKKVWQELSQKLTQIRDSSKTLYSFQNPFNQKKASSSDEAVLTATADRNAVEETVSILVKSTAKPDKFLSKPLPKDYRVPSGTYHFTVGSKDVSVRYGGGKLSDFADVLMKRSNGLLKTQIISNTTSTQVMSIEGTKTGEENRIVFLDDASKTGIDMGFLEESGTGARRIDLALNPVMPWQAALDRSKVLVDGGTLRILAGGEGSIPITPPVEPAGKLVIEMEVKVTRKDEKIVAAAPPPGPSIPDTGTVTIAGVTVEGMRSISDLPAWTPPPAPVVRNDPVVLFAGGGGVSVPLPELKDSDDFQKIRIPLSDYVTTLSSLDFRNTNTHRDIEIRNISIFDPASRGEFNPKNIVSNASNAVISMNGIDIIRDSNDIGDLIPGLKLNLLKASDKPVDLKVEPDRKAVKDALITFVGYYNRLVTQINILTRTEGNIIGEVEYFTDDERKTAETRLGMFQGDVTLNQMKSRLQSIMTDTYRIGSGAGTAILSQYGISTDSRKPGSGGYDVSKLRGYYEINEEKLDEMIKSDLPGIKDLFGFDSDGDLIMDTGVAVRMDTYLKPFVETGGIFPAKQTGLDTKITSTNKEIDSYKVYLAQYEQNLKKKWTQMEGALNSLEQSSQSIDNFSNNSSRK